MKLKIYTANCSGKQGNSIYPNEKIIEDREGVAEAVRQDHVFAKYRGNHRSINDFIESEVIPQDCDNDISDDPGDWESPESLSRKFKDVAHVIIPSRNDMKEKGDKSARPRMHILFPTRVFTDQNEYSDTKKVVQSKYKVFDQNAVDAARFFFGSNVDPEDVIWNEGHMNIEDTLEEVDYEECESEDTNERFAGGRSILKGSRNSTMSRFAGRVIKRYGITEKAHGIFMEEADKCDPPLSVDELATIWDSAKKFGKKVAGAEGYVPPEDYEFTAKSLKPEDYSDVGQAKVLKAEYANELIYTPATEYLRYDGVRWVESKQCAVGAMEEFLDLQYEDAKDEYAGAKKALVDAGISEMIINAGGAALKKEIQPSQMKVYKAYLAAQVYYKFALKRRDMKYITSALQAAKPMLEVAYDLVDSNPFLLNCPDGTYDLRKGMAGVRKHAAGDYITKVTSVSPSDEGRKLWLDSVDMTFGGDQELIDYVQMIAGISAIGMVNLEALIISYGEGSNGKSTFWNSIAGALGGYSGTISADTLTVGCRRNVKPELAEAKGKRLLIAAELEEGMRLSTSVVKQLCSTDKISAEKKYKDPSDFIPSHMLVLYTNHLPRVGAIDPGIWRRLIVIPFTAKIEGKSDVKNYSRLLLENAAPYILKWVIEGAEKAIKCDYKFALPGCVEDAVGKYKMDSDWLEHFLEDCCEIDEHYHEKSGKLYEEYRAHCMRIGEFARSTTEFYTALEQRDFRKKRNKVGRYIIGLKLRATELFTEEG